MKMDTNANQILLTNLFVDDYDGDPINGRWYFYGIDRFCYLLKKYDYKIVSKDVIGEYDKKSPIVHFKK